MLSWFLLGKLYPSRARELRCVVEVLSNNVMQSVIHACQITKEESHVNVSPFLTAHLPNSTQGEPNKIPISRVYFY